MATRKEISEAFIAAKELTARDGNECGCSNGRPSKRFEFICHALPATGLPGAVDAGKIIRARFECDLGTSTIYGWLTDLGINTNLLSDDNVQAYKHRWLDSVIKEFSS